jgi:hypothetical protein
LSQFNRFSNPLGFFKSMLGGEDPFYLLREATDDYIAEFRSSRKTPPSRKVGGKPEGRLIGPPLPTVGFVTDQHTVLDWLSPSSRAVDVLGVAARRCSRAQNNSTGHDSRAIQIHFQTHSLRNSMG